MRHYSSIIIALAAILASSCCERPQGVKPPLMGWSSWNAYMVDISDSIITHQADLMVEKGLKEAGYRYVNIDDGFFGYRDERGYMVPHPERFPKGPEGMRALVDHIHSLGLKAGIYSDAGDNTCGSSYNHDLNGLGAGLYGHDVVDAERYFNEWDFDFIKLDYCGGQNLKLDPEERYREIRRVIDSVATRHIRINVCRWNFPGTWVNGIGDSWRISADIRPVWKSIKYIVGKNLYLSAYAGNGNYNDMDMLAVGYNIKPSPFWEEGLGLSYTEEEAHFGIWCIMSSPLLLGCDIEYIPEETMKIITNPELIAINQDRLGLQAHVVQHVGETYVFAKDILEKWGNTRAVALYNPADTSMRFTLTPEEIEMTGALTVRDLNLNADLGECSSIEMTLPPHSAKILKVSGERIEPTLYEAEWGYCPDFTAIKGTGVKYVPMEGTSGRAVAMNLGGSESNCLEWRDVHSISGGEYELSLTIQYCEEATGLRISVNGEEKEIVSCGLAKDGFYTLNTLAELNKGENCVRIWSETPLPAVDKLNITKK
ncbi:MAG: alpha-galactosidase [Candidatus Cryptobacteroides sp.]|nr:alpha-galactosidase [Bacteroidales bacterium]MDY5495931.1 alpha-galactosidase [Candidatus Cryptobacteroides sp.]